uniref:Uncharacterized protein n=1 Tax=Timema poppense TaxID=170557 RepID=A0A7R9CH66_TIMPO|nr:unnamed protein product [Timema poppensis]
MGENVPDDPQRCKRPIDHTTTETGLTCYFGVRLDYQREEDRSSNSVGCTEGLVVAGGKFKLMSKDSGTSEKKVGNPWYGPLKREMEFSDNSPWLPKPFLFKIVFDAVDVFFSMSTLEEFVFFASSVGIYLEQELPEVKFVPRRDCLVAPLFITSGKYSPFTIGVVLIEKNNLSKSNIFKPNSLSGWAGISEPISSTAKNIEHELQNGLTAQEEIDSSVTTPDFSRTCSYIDAHTREHSTRTLLNSNDKKGDHRVFEGGDSDRIVISVTKCSQCKSSLIVPLGSLGLFLTGGGKGLKPEDL